MMMSGLGSSSTLAGGCVNLLNSIKIPLYEATGLGVPFRQSKFLAWRASLFEYGVCYDIDPIDLYTICCVSQPRYSCLFPCCVANPSRRHNLDVKRFGIYRPSLDYLL